MEVQWRKTHQSNNKMSHRVKHAAYTFPLIPNYPPVVTVTWGSAMPQDRSVDMEQYARNRCYAIWVAPTLPKPTEATQMSLVAPPSFCCRSGVIN